MKEKNLENTKDIMYMVTDVVSSYVASHEVSLEGLDDIIGSVYSSIRSLEEKCSNGAIGRTPAVSVESSVTDDFLICLEDGKKLKMLKRYLRTNYNMTPDEYRAKWGLPVDYPMVSPNYAIRRSEFARQIGLGHTDHKGRGRKPKKVS